MPSTGRWIRRLVFLSFLCLLALGAVFIFFLVWFNFNPYRPQLESRLSKALQLDIKLGPLSRSWTRGPGLKVKDLQVRKNQREPLLFGADSLLLWLDPFSLMGGRLVFKTKIEGGEFYYREKTRNPPLDLKLRKIQMETRQQVPGGEIKGMGEGRILSASASDLTWWAVIEPRKQEVNFEIHFDQDKAIFRGEALPLQNPPRFQADLEFHEFDLATVFRLWNATAQDRRGLLDGTANGNFQVVGASRGGIETKRSLQGKGEFEIRNGVFRNFNVIETILRRITIVPGLEEALVAGVPSYLQPLFNRRDNPFELLQAEFKVQGGQLTFQQLLLRDRHYLLEAEGNLGFEGEVNFQARLILMEDASQFLVGRVHELSALRNAQGRIVIPFVYRGTWPHARPRPDLNFLAQKLLVEQGAQFVAKGLEALSQLRKPSE